MGKLEGLDVNGVFYFLNKEDMNNNCLSAKAN